MGEWYDLFFPVGFDDQGVGSHDEVAGAVAVGEPLLDLGLEDDLLVADGVLSYGVEL